MHLYPGDVSTSIFVFFSVFLLLNAKRIFSILSHSKALEMSKSQELPGALPPGPQPGLCPGPAWGLTAPPRPPAVLGNDLRHCMRPIYYNSKWAPLVIILALHHWLKCPLCLLQQTKTRFQSFFHGTDVFLLLKTSICVLFSVYNGSWIS